MIRGQVVNYILVKRGKQVVKFRRYNGYAVAEKDLEQVRGVELHSKEDGVIYARRDQFYKDGIPNVYLGEKQLILPVKYWEKLKEIPDSQLTLV